MEKMEMKSREKNEETESESPELTVRVAGQIRRWRKQRRLTQRALSLAIGQAPSYIATIEATPRMPSFLAGMRLCRVLGITPEDLLTPLDPEVVE